MSTLRSVVVLKPDIVQKNLVGELLANLVSAGLLIVEKYSIRYCLDTLAQFYGWTKIDYPDVLKQYLCTTNLTAIVVEGSDAIQKLLQIKKQMRLQYSLSPYENLFHCSESNEDFLREYGVLQSITTMDNQHNNNTENIKPKRTDNQVELIVYKLIGEPLFLLLKRTEARGGFWQPITGNVEVNESFKEAALRELKEETGISAVARLVETGCAFDFFDDGRIQHEEVFGAEIPESVEVQLSSEHSECSWVNFSDAMKLLKYPNNKKGLQRLCKLIEIKKTEV